MVSLRRKVEGHDDMMNLAMVSTHGEYEMAKIVAQAFERVNMDPAVGSTYISLCVPKPVAYVFGSACRGC